MCEQAGEETELVRFPAKGPLRQGKPGEEPGFEGSGTEAPSAFDQCGGGGRASHQGDAVLSVRLVEVRLGRVRDFPVVLGEERPAPLQSDIAIQDEIHGFLLHE
jgi:hypothetical protein